MESQFKDDIELIGSPRKYVSFAAGSHSITITGVDEFEGEDSTSLSETVKFGTL